MNSSKHASLVCKAIKRVFFIGRPFQPSLMFVSKDRSLPLSDIRLSYKRLQGTNTLAYYEHS